MKVKDSAPKGKARSCDLATQRDEWHGYLDRLDDLEADLVTSKLLGRAELSLALEQLNDIRDAILEARPRAKG